MAKPIQDPQVGSALQRLFKLQGRVRPALEEFVIPTVAVGDLSKGGIPPLTAGASAQGFQAAGGAGQFFTLRFEIPGGIVAQITRVQLIPIGAMAFVANFTNPGAALATTATKDFTDGRLSDQGLSPAGLVTFGTRAAIPALPRAWLGQGPVEGLVYEPPNWIVGSGRPEQFGFLEIGALTDNIGVSWCLEWREYAIV